MTKKKIKNEEAQVDQMLAEEVPPEPAPQIELMGMDEATRVAQEEAAKVRKRITT